MKIKQYRKVFREKYLGISKMELHKMILENGEVEFELYNDVTDDDIIKMMSYYPELIDASYDIQGRWSRLCKLVEVNAGFIDNERFDDMPRR